MKVLHLSTVGLCGNAAYTFSLVDQLNGLGLANEVYPIDRDYLERASRQDVWEYFRKFCQHARNFDVVHIQHEFSFFGGSYGTAFSNEVTARMLEALQGKKTMLSLHASPGVLFKAEYGVKPSDSRWKRRLKRVGYHLKGRFQNQAFDIWRERIAPHFTSQHRRFCLVHNRFTQKDCLDAGSKAEFVPVVNIGVDTLPVQEHTSTVHVETVKRYLNYQPGDVVMGTFGFLSPNKGHRILLEAMTALPPHFKLLMVGGPHPKGDVYYLNSLLHLAKDLKVFDRVYATGHYDYQQLKSYSDLMDLIVVPYLPPYPGSSASTSIPLSQGKVILASDIPTFREIRDQKDCMELVVPAAPFEMAYRIRRLFSDEDRRRYLSENAHQYAHDNSWYEVAKKHKALYEAL